MPPDHRWGGYLLQPYIESTLAGTGFSDCVVNDVLKFYIFYLIGVYGGKQIVEMARLKKARDNGAFISSGMVLILGNIVLFVTGVTFAGVIDRLVDFVIAVAGIVFLVMVSEKIVRAGAKTGKKLLTILGKDSLSIYVLQGMVIAAMRIVLTKLHMNDGLGIIPMVVCTVFGCALPLLAYFISTKIWKLDGLFYPGRYLRIGK